MSLRTISSILVAASVMGPPALHHASHGYIAAEQYVLQTANEWKMKSLRAVGLQPVKDEATIDQLIDAAADEFGIKRPLLHALAHIESRKSPTALSHKGAIGVVQVMPFNAKRCGLPHAGRLWLEEVNIRCGAQILSEELKAHRGNVRHALTVYNCGKVNCPPGQKYASDVLAIAGEKFL